MVSTISHIHLMSYINIYLVIMEFQNVIFLYSSQTLSGSLSLLVSLSPLSPLCLSSLMFAPNVVSIFVSSFCTASCSCFSQKAWIRLALNEGLLMNYIDAMIADSDTCRYGSYQGHSY